MPDNQVKVTRITLAAKMNDLANNEVLDKAEDFYCHYLQNANLFYEKSLAIRPGTEDLCGGFVWGTYSTTKLVDTLSGIGVANTTSGYRTLSPLTTGTVYPNTVYIPQGQTVLLSGNLSLRAGETSASLTNLGSEAFYDIDVRVWAFALNTSPLRASGISFMKNSTGAIYDIGLSGKFMNTSPYPQFQSQTLPTPSGSVPVGVASARINFGQYSTLLTGTYYSNQIQVPFKFDAPVYVNSGIAYSLRYTYELTSGTKPRNVEYYYIQNTGVDWSRNTRLAEENSDGFQKYAIQDIAVLSGAKPWVAGQLWGYNSSNYLSPENSTADWDLAVPVISGTDNVIPTVYNTNNTSNNRPPFALANNNAYTSEVGQVFNTITGLNTFYGAYFWANLKTDLRTFLREGGLAVSPANSYSTYKDVKIVSTLSEITSSSGNLTNGNFIAASKTVLGSGSVTHTFDSTKGSKLTQQTIEQTPNYELDKIYVTFDTPVSQTFTPGSNYLLSFGFYDPDTDERIGDYAYQYRSLQFDKFYSSFTVGAQDQNPPNYSGGIAFDYYGNGVFYQPSGLYGNIYSSMNLDLTCGLISVTSGSWINGIYDYRIGGDRVSQIVYGQGQYQRFFALDNPNRANHTQIFSSGSPLQDALWTFATYDDLMFSHQYSQISGTCWDQTYLNTSGYDSTQLHGQRPQFSMAFVSGVGTVGSGVTGQVQVMLATQMATGGYRASDIQTITLSGQTNSIIRLLPPGGVTQHKNSIQESGAYPIKSQYAFDVYGSGPHSGGNATYVFCTQPSGSIFYLAQMVSAASSAAPSFNGRTNPLPNINTFIDSVNLENTYINYKPDQLTQQISTVLATTQNYLVSQVDTPKFKKIQVYYDYLLGIGDPNFNSRLWYSEQYAPQIWGESFNFHGFIDVNKDNGSPLTSMEKLRQYMILFKKNSTYRVSYLGNSNSPFAIDEISSKIGSLGAFGTITVGDVVYGLSQYGIFACDGNSVRIISDSIKPFYDDLDHADLTFAVALHDMNHSNITWSITNNTFSPESNIGIVFDYKEGSFSVRKGPMWNAAATVENSDGFDVLLGGTSDGQIEIQDSEASNVDVYFNDGAGYQVTKDIEFIAETPWLSIDDSQYQKQIKFIDLNTNNVDASLGVEVFFDQDEDTAIYSRAIACNQKSPDKRVTLGGQAKTMKLKFYNVDKSPTLKINNISIYFIPIGHNLPG